MDESIEKLLKKYGPQYKAFIQNFNRNGYKRLIALREAKDPQNKNFNKKLSQRAISKISDILPQNYNKIEKGRINGGNNVTLEQAIKFSVIYGCSIDYIAYGKVSESENQTILSLESQLDTERKLNKLQGEEIERLKILLQKKKK